MQSAAAPPPQTHNGPRAGPSKHRALLAIRSLDGCGLISHTQSLKTLCHVIQLLLLYSWASTNLGYDLFNIRLESSPISREDLSKQRKISDILIAAFTITGLLVCTGAYNMFCKKRHAQRYWKHASCMAIGTICCVRVIYFYFFFKFLGMIVVILT